MSLEGIRLVSWDLDGTLYSRNRLAFKLWTMGFDAVLDGRSREAFKEMGEIRRFWGAVKAQRTQDPARRVRMSPEYRAYVLALEKRWLGQCLMRMQVSRPALRVLEALRDQGMRQIVLSDFIGHYKLACLQLNGYFEQVLAAEELGYWKPSPEPFWMAQRLFGVLPEEHLHIGDRQDTDGAGALAAGCRYLPAFKLGTLIS